MSSISHTAISGINAMQVLIDNTVSKIQHINTKKPEKLLFVESVSDKSYSNTAVKVKEIYDNYNDFIMEEKRKTSATVTNEQTKIEQLSKLEDLLYEKSNIFNSLINELFLQIQQDIVLGQQNVINEEIEKKFSNIIVSLKDFGTKIKFLEKDIKISVINNIEKVNTLINEIHEVNTDIKFFPVTTMPQKNELLSNKRDDLIDELNDLIGIKVVRDHDDYKLYLNNDICIIDGDKKQNLMALTSDSDDSFISIAYVDIYDHATKKIDDTAPDGVLGSLLRFRREDLTNAKNKIGQLSVNFADSINAYSQVGYDMFGNIGKPLFNISDPQIISSVTNSKSFVTSAKWISADHAKDTDYVIYFTNNHWTVTRLSNRTNIQPKISEEQNSTVLTFDGIQFTINGNSTDGDIYMIKPYSKTLDELELLIVPNAPFALSSNNQPDQSNRNNAIIMHELNTDKLVDHTHTLSDAYQNFFKSVAYKCNALEEEVPFKVNMINILKNKKISISKNVDQDWSDLNYQQECYLANVKVLKITESIFNDIVDCYS